MQASLSSSVFTVFKSLLQKDPTLLKKYVTVGLAVVDSAISPLDKLLKHLLMVQDIDPDTVPGQKQRRALEAALMESFNRLDEKDFDDDYDFAWVDSKFNNVRSKLEHLNLSKEKFKDLTDLSDYPANPFSAAQAAKYAPEMDTSVIPSAVIDPSIGEPHRRREDRLRPTKNDIKAEESNRTHYGNLPLSKDSEETAQQAYDPRDPAMKRLEALLKKVEAKVGTGVGEVRAAKAMLDLNSELKDLLSGKFGILGEYEEIGDGQEEEEDTAIIPPKKTKKTANKTHGVGSFSRNPSKPRK